MRYSFFILIAIVFFICSCDGQNECDELKEFIFKNTSDKNVYYETYTTGKEAIPCLIDLIDINKKSMVGFLDPKASTLYPFMINNQIGIKSAYLIELILAKDSIEVITIGDWEEKIKPYRVYRNGVIVIIKDSETVLEQLSHKDMKVIKDIYMNWWKLNQDKSIELLRKEWREGDHILDKTCYKWI